MAEWRDPMTLEAGDPCEFRYPARQRWLHGIVVKNGGMGYWSVRDQTDDEGRLGIVCCGLFIENVRDVAEYVPTGLAKSLKNRIGGEHGCGGH